MIYKQFRQLLRSTPREKHAEDRIVLTRQDITRLKAVASLALDDLNYILALLSRVENTNAMIERPTNMTVDSTYGSVTITTMPFDGDDQP